MRADIQRAYDTTRFRFIAVSCHGLKCSDPEHSRGMQALLDRSKNLSYAEAMKACSTYGSTLKNMEDEYVGELNALYPQKKKR